MLEWFAFSSPGDLPDAGIKPRSPALQADSLASEPPGKSNCAVAMLFSFRGGVGASLVVQMVKNPPAM